MPDLKTSPATTAAAHADARVRADRAVYTTATSPLQQRHFDAIARANKVCRSEPGVLSKYALGEVIAQIEADQIHHGDLHQIAECITLNRVIARLKTLIPI